MKLSNCELQTCLQPCTDDVMHLQTVEVPSEGSYASIRFTSDQNSHYEEKNYMSGRVCMVFTHPLSVEENALMAMFGERAVSKNLRGVYAITCTVCKYRVCLNRTANGGPALWKHVKMGCGRHYGIEPIQL